MRKSLLYPLLSIVVLVFSTPFAISQVAGQHALEAVEPDTCRLCHGDNYDAWVGSKHSAVGTTCESCHGSGDDHITGPAANPMTIDLGAELCGQCHVEKFSEWDTSGHSDEPVLRAESCMNCRSADNLFNTDLITLPGIKMTIENATNPVTCVSCHSGHGLGLRISRPEFEGYPIAWDLGSDADWVSVCHQCHTGGGTPEEKVKSWHHDTGEVFTGSVHDISGVTCVDCHMAPGSRSHTMSAEVEGSYDRSCGQAVGCHSEQGPAWPELVLEEVQTTVNASLHKVEEAIAQAQAAITEANETAGVSEAAITEAEDLLAQAESYFTHAEAEGSLGFHNPTRVLSLLNTAMGFAGEAEAAALSAKIAVPSVVTVTTSVVSTERTTVQTTVLTTVPTTVQTTVPTTVATTVPTTIATTATATVETPSITYTVVALIIGLLIGVAAAFLRRPKK